MNILELGFYEFLPFLTTFKLNLNLVFNQYIYQELEFHHKRSILYFIVVRCELYFLICYVKIELVGAHQFGNSIFRLSLIFDIKT